MVAHHISGNHYDHRSTNGIIIDSRVHYLFHHFVVRIISKGFEAFINAVASLGVPALLERLSNPDKVILFKTKSDEEFQNDVIRLFCGSLESYCKLIEILLKEAEGQTEKEIQFDIML